MYVTLSFVSTMPVDDTATYSFHLSGILHGYMKTVVIRPYEVVIGLCPHRVSSLSKHLS